jgi:hypothetical protein
MRDAGRRAGHCMRERAYNFSDHFRVGLGTHTVFTIDSLYSHATRRKQKFKLRMIRSVKFYACGSIPRA